MSRNDERNPPPEPTPLTLEEAVEKITKIEKRTAPLWPVIVIMFLILGAGMAMLVLNQPKEVVEKHPNANDSTRVEMAALRDSFNVLKAQGVPAVLSQIAEERTYDARASEEARVLVTQLEERLNRHELK